MALQPRSTGYISKISNHNVAVSQGVAQALDVALEAGGELMLAWQAEDARRRMAEVTSEAMKRRTLMAGTTGLILGGLLPGRQRPATAWASPM